MIGINNLLYKQHKVAAATVPQYKTDIDDLEESRDRSAYFTRHLKVHFLTPGSSAKCKTRKYLAKLPTVSIIIPFFEEHWSTLLRSCHSIINRSPPELIKDIILVDDHSTKNFLGEKLEAYLESFLPKAKVVRLPERSGLITARLAGARKAKGEVLIFLDSHIEVGYNWLPPLLDPIAKNPKTCVCPFIDVISYETFEFKRQDDGARGGFNWDFLYKRLPLLPEDNIDKAKPFRSPIMAGGLFAIGAEFFWDIGGYDEGLAIWGGEQYELSFKIWMCGGQMFDAPCSSVGHVYRGGTIKGYANHTKGKFLYKNYKRVAEVWMDEFKDHLYTRNPEEFAVEAGDLTAQKSIRERLQCKSFKWYMEEIAFDIIERYPLTPPPVYAEGVIQSDAHPMFCLDTLGQYRNGKPGLYNCAENKRHPQYNQHWELSMHKDIRNKRENCLDVSSTAKNAPVILFMCHYSKGHQQWHYDLTNKWIVHMAYKRCLEADFLNKKVYVNDCDLNNRNMKWNFGYVNHTGLNQYFDYTI